ncbi:IclR family transcriptional regulator [Sphingomonas sp. AOB5]|uniref:IclR family transcriptional regulator n=1 Tax=Sphingomonas sp. AOB5 TaxID=3034017 RepID=UPI0023F639A1|nr:IclR family transcriptional regulator [Sphingomonas sp. AOB5]MDF7776720.1 IclR family transcriptional regulator [Sphingomonas sp. AOB5]
MAASIRETASGERELNKATVRVLEVLSSFASDVPGYGVTELAQALGMTKNMTYRALTTLVEQGYVVREKDGSRYQLGYRVLELQNPLLVDPDFRSLCQPYVQQMHAITGESIGLVVRAGDYCVLIDGVETRKHGVYRIRIGTLFSLWGPATGRVLLAGDGDAAVADYLARHDPGDSQVLAEIERIRAQGYARVARATPPQMVSVAFPVHDIDGRLHGSISVGGPRERFEAQLERQMPELQDLVAELNQRSRLFPADDAGSELH